MDGKRRAVISGVADEMRKRSMTRGELEALKTKMASGHRTEVPPNKEILKYLNGEEKGRFIKFLQKKPGRTASGISIVAVMAKPEKCPHGTCVYCPTIKGVPQSYVDGEPAVMRAKALDYDAFRQAKCRTGQLLAIGHPASKVELVVMGGTFTSRTERYQKSFIKGCYDGLNGFSSGSLKQAQMTNETAKHRCVGLAIETRPDWVHEKEIGLMLSFGATRVEIGVQNPDDEIYEIVKRGHKVEDVIKATRILKDSGLKVCYHIMPNLPGSDSDKDLRMFSGLFSDERFRPDMIKLYPTLVVGGSELDGIHKKGGYDVYSDEELINLIIEMKRIVPEYVRIMRLQRDVPSQHIIAGCRYTNLREIVLREMKKRGLGCRCIRCREVRHREISTDDIEKSEIRITEYEASDGTEHFLQYLTPDGLLLGLLRLRFPGSPFREEITGKTALVRELRVFGPSTPVGAGAKTGIQHRGIGRSLLEKAEAIAKECGSDKMLVTSGVGAREYYRKLGYAQDGAYMGKSL